MPRLASRLSRIERTAPFEDDDEVYDRALYKVIDALPDRSDPGLTASALEPGR